MIAPQQLQTTTATASAGATTVVATQPGATVTAVSDAEWTGQSGQAVTIASVGEELPVLNPGDIIAIEAHSTAGNNGVYVVTGTPAIDSVDVVKLTPGAPADAAAEAVSVISKLTMRPYVAWFSMSTPTVAGTASLLFSPRIVATTGATGAPVTSQLSGGPLIGNVGESIKVSGTAETASLFITYGWVNG